LAELRLILLGLGAPAIAAIWWWSARRSTQARGNAELRESTIVPAHPPVPSDAESEPPEQRPAPGEHREWGISPLEPLSIMTADFERVPALDGPMTTHCDALELTVDLGQPLPPDPEIHYAAPAAPSPSPPAPQAAAPAPQAAAPAPQATAPAPQATAPAPRAPAPAAASPVRLRPITEQSDRLAAVAPQVPNASEKQKIITVRVCAVGEARWSGADLMSVLEGHGLAFGRYQVYHRKHSDGRSVFFVASLIEPGTFDIALMPDEEFRGVSIFAVLPGPLDALQTIDVLLATARDLARELSGTLQDAKGMPLSPQRVAALREDVARFQASLP
jgi:cell division protein ZipA